MVSDMQRDRVNKNFIAQHGNCDLSFHKRATKR